MNDVLDAIVYRIETPDGTLFVTVGADKEGVKLIHMSIGKTGTAAQAWADATGRLATSLLAKGDINTVIEAVSGITADKVRTTMDGSIVRSGPEGLAVALLKYRRYQYELNAPRRKEGDAYFDN
jgi:hypothetical protein